MNAYELAKKLEWYTNYDEFVEAGAMLRQQADRIAELEKELSVWRNARVPDEIMESTRKSILSMVNTRIAELEQEVVMYRTDAERLTMRIIDFSVSPQIKELSDEEITEVLNDENIAEYHQGNWLVLPYAFARAILKKASEK